MICLFELCHNVVCGVRETRDSWLLGSVASSQINLLYVHLVKEHVLILHTHVIADIIGETVVSGETFTKPLEY